MARLRAPDGCTWDRAQDRRSLKGYVVEEAYEVCDAIDSGDVQAIRSELGDLLFQIVFQAQIGQERGEFDMHDVVDAISDKMEQRHPHVFDPAFEGSPEDGERLWERRKGRERRDVGVMHGIPTALPALHKARRITDKAAGAGFDWPSPEGAWAKVDEELAELRAAVSTADAEAIRHELGDVLLAIVNVARFLRADPEDALQGAIGRFVRRFSYVEDALRARNVALEDASLETMDGLWNEAKSQEP